MKLLFSLIATLLLTACSNKSSKPYRIVLDTRENGHFLIPIQSNPTALRENWATMAKSKAVEHGLDPRLVSAIIHVESKWDAAAVSRSNAIGLMQIKATTAGREVYRLRGKSGEPSVNQLKDPAINIDIGTAYLQHLQQTALSGIRDPLTLRYATIVAYVNGAGALLRTFSKNRHVAIAKINKLTPAQFYQYIGKRHPAIQAPRYLWKVTQAYQQS